MKTILLECDEDDDRAIQEAIALRQRSPRVMPDGGGNLAGRVVAEICRAFVDYRWDVTLDEEDGWEGGG